MRVTAKKSFVTSPGHADGYVVSTLDAAPQSPVATTICLVLRGDRGISVSGMWNGLWLRGNASAPMALEDVDI